MLRNRIAVATMVALTSMAAVSQGCGDDESAATTGGNQTGRVWPVDPAAGPGDGASNVTFAISEMKALDGNWQDTGYNLDALITTKGAESTGQVCKPLAGANADAIHPDGTDGIDNSFGKTIQPLLAGIISNPQSTINQALADGGFTIMFDIEALGASADYSGLTARLYAGQDLMMAPAFDGSDVWPVSPALLNNPSDITSSKVSFSGAYMAGNTFVSGTPTNVPISLDIGGNNITLTIENAIITMDVDAGRTGATNGVIAGVLNTESFITELLKIAGGFDTTFCDPESASVQNTLNVIRSASDMVSGGSQSGSADCSGISIALGFNAKTVTLGPVGPAGMPGPDPCAM